MQRTKGGLSQAQVLKGERDTDITRSNSPLLSTDSSVEIETEIEDFEKTIFDMDEKCQQFRIGNINHKLGEATAIFEAVGPNKKLVKKTDCQSCKIVTFQKDKEIKYCQFCGCSVCKDCLTKTRIFPKAKLDNNGERQRGDICRLCDRKFLVRIMLLEAQSIAAKNTNKAKKLDEEIAEAHGTLRMLHAMKVIRNKMHVAKIKKEQELTDKLINDNERRYVEIQELKKEL